MSVPTCESLLHPVDISIMLIPFLGHMFAQNRQSTSSIVTSRCDAADCQFSTKGFGIEGKKTIVDLVQCFGEPWSTSFKGLIGIEYGIHMDSCFWDSVPKPGSSTE